MQRVLRCQQVQRDSDKKEVEARTSAASLSEKFISCCKEIGIEVYTYGIIMDCVVWSRDCVVCVYVCACVQVCVRACVRACLRCGERRIGGV